MSNCCSRGTPPREVPRLCGPSTREPRAPNCMAARAEQAELAKALAIIHLGFHQLRMGENRLFQCLDLYWRSPEFGELRYKAGASTKRICSQPQGWWLEAIQVRARISIVCKIEFFIVVCVRERCPRQTETIRKSVKTKLSQCFTSEGGWSGLTRTAVTLFSLGYNACPVQLAPRYFFFFFITLKPRVE